jgi:MFS family permease
MCILLAVVGQVANFFFPIQIGPIIAGAMADHVGWRNFWWLNVALHAVIFLISLVGFPETKWHRRHPTEARIIRAGDSSPTNDKETESEGIEKIDTEKQSPTRELAVTKQTTSMRDPYLGKGSPKKSQFGLWQTQENMLKSIALDVWIPWKMFAFPIVEFASFVVSWSASCFLTLNLTQSQVFAAPPYNFSSETIGFFNFAIFIGGLIGMFTAGPTSDWISARLTKRNRGIREPEMRLPTMIPFVLIMILGNFIVAFGYQYKWDWRVRDLGVFFVCTKSKSKKANNVTQKAIVIIGYTCAGIQVAALPAITSTYAVDSYKPVAGSLFVAITVNKNVWGYGFSAFITPWSEESGFIDPIMTNMCLTALWCSFGVVFWFFGKKFRHWTRNDQVHSM